MKKIFSQMAGAAAVVAAVSAGLAYAQVNPSTSAPANTQPVDQRMNTGSTAPATTPSTGTVTPPRSEDLKSNSTASPYGAGGNNGSVYNPAIRSTETKPGNVSSVDDPAARTATTATTTTATPATTTPATTPMPSSTTTDSTPYVAPAPATATTTTDGNWNADGTRAARADRN